MDDRAAVYTVDEVTSTFGERMAAYWVSRSLECPIGAWGERFVMETA